MPKSTKVATLEPKMPVAPSAPQTLSVEGLIDTALKNNVSIETIERLMVMRKELKAEWAKEQYDDPDNGLRQRMINKGMRFAAFEAGNLQTYLNAIDSEEFDKEHYESSRLVNFQGARKDIL